MFRLVASVPRLVRPIRVAASLGARSLSAAPRAQDGMMGSEQLEYFLHVLDELERDPKTGPGANSSSSSSSNNKGGLVGRSGSDASAAAEAALKALGSPSAMSSAAAASKIAAAFRASSQSFDMKAIKAAPVDTTFSVQLNSFTFHTVDRGMVHGAPSSSSSASSSSSSLDPDDILSKMTRKLS